MYTKVIYEPEQYPVDIDGIDFYLNALDRLHAKYQGRFCTVRLNGSCRQRYTVFEVLQTIGFKIDRYSSDKPFIKEWHGYDEIQDDIQQILDHRSANVD